MVTLVFTDGSDTVEVNFDVLVLWDGIAPTTFTMLGDTFVWLDQPDPFRVRAQGPGNYTTGDAWSMPGPETHIAPVPQLAQSGFGV